jgi:hypothetical protein
MTCKTKLTSAASPPSACVVSPFPHTTRHCADPTRHSTLEAWLQDTIPKYSAPIEPQIMPLMYYLVLYITSIIFSSTGTLHWACRPNPLLLTMLYWINHHSYEATCVFTLCNKQKRRMKKRLKLQVSLKLQVNAVLFPVPVPGLPSYTPKLNT